MQNRNNRIAIGIICIIISSLGFGLMQLFVKLAGDLPSIQKSFFRNLIAMVISIIPVLKMGIPKINMKGKWSILLLRSLCGTLGIILNFMAISYIPLGDASILQKLSPFVVIICSIIFLKENVKPYQWAAIFVAFIGVIIIVKPVGGSINLGHLLAIGGAIMAGIAYTCVRILGIKGVRGEFIIFFFSLFSCLSLVPFVIFQYKPMSYMQILYLFLVGISALLGQFGITFAYAFAPAKNIAVFEYSQILFAAMLGFVFLSEVPSITAWIGYTIIIGVGIFMIVRGSSEK